MPCGTELASLLFHWFETWINVKLVRRNIDTNPWHIFRRPDEGRFVSFHETNQLSPYTSLELGSDSYALGGIDAVELYLYYHLSTWEIRFF